MMIKKIFIVDDDDDDIIIASLLIHLAKQLDKSPYCLYRNVNSSSFTFSKDSIITYPLNEFCDYMLG